MSAMRPAKPKLFPILNRSEWNALIPAMGRANRSLAEYNGMIRRLRNSDLLLAPLRLQEAVLSSRIEGTLATLSEVLQFEAGELPVDESRRRDIEEILNYRVALDAAVEELRGRPFGLRLLLQLHKLLLNSVRGHDKAPGEFRKQQNYIGSRVGGRDVVRFVPPAWAELASAFTNWEAYYHNDADEPIVRLALLHAQFEFLHPFLDGNGRIGRIIIPIFLFEKQLLSQPTFYLSEYIEEHREEYVDHLHRLGTSKTGWHDWVVFFLEAVTVQARQNAEKADRILALYEELKERFIFATRSRYAIPLLDSVFERQYFSASQLTWKGQKPSKPTLMTLLQGLQKHKVITVYRDASGQRPAIYWLPDIIRLVES